MTITEWLGRMRSMNGSDLFLTEGKSPRLRVDGRLILFEQEIVTQDDFLLFFNDWLADGVLKRLAAEKEMDIGLSVDEKNRFRISLFRQKGQLSMVVRQVPVGEFDWEALRLPETLKAFTELSRGLVLISGAIGSGKSTTMAALLDCINSRMACHILTIEDPVEFVHIDKCALVSQREIGSDTADFLPALRSALRQSPDLIFIGELRDSETVKAAISAALTGHLVFATLHSQDVVHSFERLMGMFPERERDRIALDLSVALEGIVSQQLVPGIDDIGLVSLFEIFFKTPFAERLIANRRFIEIEDVIKSHESDGMVNFSKSLAESVEGGIISVDAALANATNRDELQLLLQKMTTGRTSYNSGGKKSTDPGVELSIRDLLVRMFELNGSDLILTVGSVPGLRVSGELRQLATFPILTEALTRRLLFSVLSAEQRATFEEDKEIDFAMGVEGHFEAPDDRIRNHRFRVNGFFQRGSVGAVFRLVPQNIPTPDAIRMPQAVQAFAFAHQGMVLVTGPTGSGKTTTLAALLNEINQKQSRHIITIEDPIEFIHKNVQSIVEQREVGSDTHSFSSALKHALREDPDIILVGELRDTETIAAALTAAETGHLVFATLHTNDAAQSLDRIVDVFPSLRQEQIRVQLSACLNGVVSQRLLPRRDLPGERIAAFEVMLATSAIRKQIREGQTHLIKGTLESSGRFGMVTMRAALEALLQEQFISQETFLRSTADFGGIG